MRDDPGVVTTRVDRWLRAATAVLAVSGMVACSSDDSTGVRAAGANQLAFTLGPSTTTADTTTPIAIAFPIAKNGDTLDLSQVAVTLDRAELKRVHDDACENEDDDDQGEDHDGDRSGPSNGSGHDDCAEVKVGGTTVDLPLDGQVVTVPADSLPAGMYREIEVRISTVELKGTFNSKTFDVTLPLRLKSEIEFQTPLTVVDGTPTTITLNLPIDQWLTDSDGSLIDPAELATNPTLLAQVKARIAASLRAFEDRDHDGHDDHDGDHGDHGNRGPG